MDYLYDNSFEGFLTCVYHHYYTQKADGIYIEDKYQHSILKESYTAVSDETFASRVYSAMENVFTAYDMKRIYRAFLSDIDGKEMIILNYIRLGFVKGGEVWKLHGNNIVYEFQRIDKKVADEVHRLKGFVRLSYLKGDIAYGVIEPEHRVLELLAEHFADRFKNQPFIIHDKRRNTAVISYDGKWCITPFTEDMMTELSDNEQHYRNLWKEYFGSIGIKERINIKCQKNFMPVRYRKHLTEMK